MSMNQSLVFTSPISDMFCEFVRYYVEYGLVKGQVFWSIVEPGNVVAKQGGMAVFWTAGVAVTMASISWSSWYR